MLRKAMEVLTLFSSTRAEIGVTEAAKLLDRSKSTVSRWLSAMEEAGFLERDAEIGRYRLSMRLAMLGEVARRSTSLQRLARPALEDLVKLTGETADLVVLSGDDAINVDMVESPKPLKHVGWIGRKLPLHATASGKCLLASRPPDEIKALLKRSLTKFTPHTITDRVKLKQELERVRRQGYAIAWGELEEDLVGVAAPVRDHRDEVVCVLTIGAPMSRVTRESLPVVRDHVMAVARTMSDSLGNMRSSSV